MITMNNEKLLVSYIIKYNNLDRCKNRLEEDVVQYDEIDAF
jgi:hypothetical protein